MELPQWLTGAARAQGRAVASERPQWLASQVAAKQAVVSSKPGWLRAAAPDGPQETILAAPSAPTFVEDDAMPSWLAREAGDDSSLPTSEPADAESSLPDWLSGFSEEKPAATAPSSTDAAPDWLSAFDEEKPAASTPAPLADTPDWLSGFGEEKPAAAPSPTDAVPDWLSALDEEKAAASTPAPLADTPDWLSGFGEEMPATPSPLADTPDWLSGFGEEMPATPSPLADTPDWLSGFGEEKPAAPSPTDAVPDWLSELGSEKTPVSEADANLLSALGLPDQPGSEPGVSAPRSGLTGLFEAAEKEGTDVPPGGMTDLLSKLASAPANEPAPQPDPFMVEPEPSMEPPEWLKRRVAAVKPEPQEEGPGAEEAPAPEPMDWLEDLDSPATQSPPLPSLPPADDDIAALLSLSESSGAESQGTPDWLQGLDMGPGSSRAAASEPGTEASIEAVDPASPPESAAAWLRGIEDQGSALPEVDTSQQLPAEMLSALDSLRFDALSSQMPTATGPEKVGALKDVSGVLKPEIIFEGSALAAAPFVEEWLISGPQRARAARLADLLAEEKEEGVGSETQQYTLPALRVIASLVLFTAVLLSLLGGLQPLPVLVSRPGLQHTIALVDALPEQGRVLLVMEAEPDSIDELAPLGSLILADFAARDVELVTISTRPQGPALAEQLAAQAGIDATHLGYLPARTTAISRLIHGGLGQPFAFDAGGQPTGLSGERLADLDLDLVLILAPRFEDLRPWVEQSSGQLEAPLLVIASTGSAPLALPYQDSGQLAALTWGLNDALTYDVARHGIAGPDLLARVGAQAVGSATAAALIALGAIFFGVRALRRRRG